MITEGVSTSSACCMGDDKGDKGTDLLAEALRTFLNATGEALVSKNALHLLFLNSSFGLHEAYFDMCSPTACAKGVQQYKYFAQYIQGIKFCSCSNLLGSIECKKVSF